VRSPEISPFLGAGSLEAFRNSHYTAVIAALGYEKRARQIPSQLANGVEHKVALAFNEHTTEADYPVNKAYFKDAGFEIEVRPQEELSVWMREWLLSVGRAQGEPLSVAIDVSSMSRVRIARLLAPLAAHTLEHPIEVDLVYTPAKFVDPPPEPEITEVNGPVIDWFGGWSPDLRQPVVAFLGLGYERDRSVGAMEYIEPASIWAFEPGGEDSLYDEKMHAANEWLYEEVPPERVVGYTVADPFECFATMEGLVFDELRRGSRPVLVPMGPKIFAVVSMLVALIHRPWTAVWRVSPGDYATVQPRESAGKLVGIHATFPPR
jgi:hypothetical protein